MRLIPLFLLPFLFLFVGQTLAETPRYLTIEGRIICEGKGVADVPVSDGFSVVSTDKNGNYSITTTSLHSHIFYSLPSGFESPVVNGVPEFYAPIDPSKKKQTIHFSIQKSSGSQQKHAVVVWADPQVLEENEFELLRDVVKDVKHTIDSVAGLKPVYAISCGDNVFDRLNFFDNYKKEIAVTGIPFYHVPGNHDLDYNHRSNDYSAKSYSNHFGPAYYSFNKGDIHYIVLKNVFYYGFSHRYIGYIDETQLNWLEQDLARVKPGSTVMVSLHIPTVYGDSEKPSDFASEMSNSVMNRKALFEILKPFKVHLLAGHSHTQWNTLISDKMMEHTHAAASAAWWQGEVCIDGSPKGYTVYEADGDKLTWYFKGVGLSKDEQFKLYPVNADSSNPECFIANVYNFDPQWKVEWLEDGKAAGAMEQYWGVDPLAKELYQPGKNKKFGWLSAGSTHHIFRAKPKNLEAKITVVVTDRFGNVYKKNLTN